MSSLLYQLHLQKAIVPFAIVLVLVAVGCRFYFDKTKDNFTVPVINESVQRGENLTYNVCGGCHYDDKIKKFIGKPLNDLPKIGGRLFSSNLTRSEKYGVPPHYTDAELSYLIKTGIAKNGRFMPYMMKPMMADEDINAIIAYLRSDDPAVAATDTVTGKSRINFIGKTGIRFYIKPEPYKKGITKPAETNTVAYGGYLTAIAGCYHCHSKKVGGLDYVVPEASKGYMEGGMKLKDEKGKKIYGPNLTPDKETGIGNYSLEDLTNALKEGVTPSGRKLSAPMPRFKHFNDTDVKAIYAYLAGLEPVHHKVKRRE